MNPINSSIIAVALVSIGQVFGAGTDATTWLVSAVSALLLIATVASRSLPGTEPHPDLRAHLDAHGHHAFPLRQRLHLTDRSARPVAQRS